jgi:predicted secreted protein
MGYVSAFAVFFILWWLVLFATLPFSLRTQDEDGDVTLGTEASAPRGPHMLRAMLRTTVVSLVIFGGLYLLNQVYGFGINDIPRFMPDFEHNG